MWKACEGQILNVTWESWPPCSSLTVSMIDVEEVIDKRDEEGSEEEGRNLLLCKFDDSERKAGLYTEKSSLPAIRGG